MGQSGGKVLAVSIVRLLSIEAQHRVGSHLITSCRFTGGWKIFINYQHQNICANRLYTTQKMDVHKKARCKVYPRTEKDPVERLKVTDEQVPWKEDCPGYESVPQYTSPSVLRGPVWADKPDPTGINFNKKDGPVNRISYTGEYEVVDGFPRNPAGRTGLRGRGCLGRWGPNHAGDPIVTRWKRNEQGDKVYHKSTGKPILQFVAVQRSDNKEWALPGGMVDPDETRTEALKREFGEEALNSKEATPEQREKIAKDVEKFFAVGDKIYKGYVDDPRNTDNSWMETKALNFHDEEGTGAGSFELNAGDDAIGAKWMDIDSSLNLYASHISFIQGVVERKEAHW